MSVIVHDTAELGTSSRTEKTRKRIMFGMKVDAKYNKEPGKSSRFEVFVP